MVSVIFNLLQWLQYTCIKWEGPVVISWYDILTTSDSTVPAVPSISQWHCMVSPRVTAGVNTLGMVTGSGPTDTGPPHTVTGSTGNTTDRTLCQFLPLAMYWYYYIHNVNSLCITILEQFYGNSLNCSIILILCCHDHIPYSQELWPTYRIASQVYLNTGFNVNGDARYPVNHDLLDCQSTVTYIEDSQSTMM